MVASCSFSRCILSVLPLASSLLLLACVDSNARAESKGSAAPFEKTSGQTVPKGSGAEVDAGAETKPSRETAFRETQPSGAHAPLDGTPGPGDDENASESTAKPTNERDDHESPSFQGKAQPLSDDVREEMKGRSWTKACPVQLDELSLLTVSHWDMEGNVVLGELVVASDVADDLLLVFEKLFELEFPIERMRRISHYDGDDDRSMADNNTSAFNCRRVAGTNRWSEHSFGTAVDINPVMNPYVRGEHVAPPAGRQYLDRSDARPGMLVPGAAVRAFKDIGWGWGGDWRSLKDYQHFSRSGR